MNHESELKSVKWRYTVMKLFALYIFQIGQEAQHFTMDSEEADKQIQLIHSMWNDLQDTIHSEGLS